MLPVEVMEDPNEIWPPVYAIAWVGVMAIAATGLTVTRASLEAPP
jgi:hypothetical protein